MVVQRIPEVSSIIRHFPNADARSPMAKTLALGELGLYWAPRPVGFQSYIPLTHKKS